ncbi:MAG: AAA family ATPase [Candidatus Thermoplasmatota archaeon]|nr:AAA family ATPase [Candidatus Thermoplasmatota archaeon]
MILRDKRKLGVSYIPEKTPCRENEKNRLSLLLENGRALISGEVGTGKTLLAKHTGGDVYVNCYTTKSEHKVLEEILHQIRPNFSTAGLAGQRLWREIVGEHLIILDEIDGMDPKDLTHFAYTISRQAELREGIRYVAVTRSALMLRQIIHDMATWSTFAEKAVVELHPYSRNQIVKILEYRAGESLVHGSYDNDILSLIADIALVSAGHMRSGIDLLRNSAMIADQRGHEKILPEDVREANREGWLNGLTELDRRQALVLLSVAVSCRSRAYVDMDTILKEYISKCEEYDTETKEKEVKKNLQLLLNQGLVYESESGYTILDCPAEVLVKEIENFLKA